MANPFEEEKATAEKLEENIAKLNVTLENMQELLSNIEIDKTDDTTKLKEDIAEMRRLIERNQAAVEGMRKTAEDG